MSIITLILLLLAAVCFMLTALNTVTQRVNLLGLGLFFWVLVPLIDAFQTL